MEYTSGTIHRVLMIRFDHGEDLLTVLQNIVIEEKITCGWLQIMGGMRSGKVVTGPEEPVMPPQPVWQEITEAKEIIATGSVLLDEEQPIIHLHGAMGDAQTTIVGCMRERVKTYLLLEAVLYVFDDMQVSRKWYEDGKFYRMEFNN